MTLPLIIILLTLWVFLMAWSFYRRMDWKEPAEPSPDLQTMHKRQAELLHIQEILVQAASEGKLSEQVIREYNRFCDQEIEVMESIERAWKGRRRN